MTSRGQSFVATYMAWDTSTNVFAKGDAANHTIVLNRDGVIAAATNAVTEISSSTVTVTGAYALALTTAEATCNTIWIGGQSSSANISIIPITFAMEQLPVAAPGTNNGLVTVGSGAGQISMASGFVNSNVQQWEGLPPLALTAGLVQASATVTGITSQAQFGVNVVTIAGAVAGSSLALGNTNVVNIGGTAIQQASGFAQVNLVQWEALPPLPLTGGGLVQASAAASVSGTVNANVIQINGSAVQAASGFAQVNLVQWEGLPPLALSAGLVQATATLQGTTSIAQFGVNVVTWEGDPPNRLQNGLVQVATVSGAAAGVLTTVNANAIQIAGIPAATSLAGGNVNVVSIAGLGTSTSFAAGNVNLTTWQGAGPNPLQNGLVQVAQVSGAATSVIGAVGSVTGNVGGNVVGSVGSVTARVTANTDQWAGVTVNALISGRVDASVGQMQPNSIQTGTFNPGALATTVFATNFLTSALVDITAENAIADALLDRSNAIETGLTPRQAWRLGAAADGGVTSGAGTTGFHIVGAGVSTARVSAVTDQSGNRLAVTLTL